MRALSRLTQSLLLVLLLACACATVGPFLEPLMRDMVDGVSKLGFRWEEQCFGVDDAGFQAGLPKLKRSVIDRRPVIVGLHDPPIGHVVVLVGFDETRRQLTFLDPNESVPGLRAMTEDAFRLLWREDIVDSRCAIFTRPR
jgi:hypothetical protein